MNSAMVGLLSAVIVAISSFAAQTLLQKKNLMATMRQERREALTAFLTSANKGIRSVKHHQDLANAIINNSLTGTDAEKAAIRKQDFDFHYSYQEEMPHSLALLYITCLESLAADGSKLTEAIAGTLTSNNLDRSDLDALDLSYDKFAKLANDHLAQLLKRSLGFRSYFTIGFLD